MTVSVLLSPVFNSVYQQTADGVPANGYRIFAYEAGSFTNLLDTYTSAEGDVANTNPIVLDSSGTQPEAIWLQAGLEYNLVLTHPDETTVDHGFDNVSGIPGSSGSGSTTNVWVATATPTYNTGTSFLVPGNFTVEFKTGNRVRLTADSGFIFGTVTSSSFSVSETTVNLVVDSGVLDPSISVAEYSVLIAQAGATVDAGGVTYTDALAYPVADTVGYQLKHQVASTTVISNTLNQELLVLTTSGTSTAYILTPDPASASYASNMEWKVKFHASSGASPTLNVSGLGAKALKQYDSSGSKVDAVIASGQTTLVLYDGTDMIIQNRLPAPVVTGSNFYQICGTDYTGSTTALYLTAGNWQLVLEGVIMESWPGNATYVAQQTATVLTVGSTTWYVYISRTGDKGHGYQPYATGIAPTTITVPSDGTYNLRVDDMTASAGLPMGKLVNGTLVGGAAFMYANGWKASLQKL